MATSEEMMSEGCTMAGWVQMLARIALLASFSNSYSCVTDLRLAWHALLRFKAPSWTLQARCCSGLKTFIVWSTEGPHSSDENVTCEGLGSSQFAF